MNYTLYNLYNEYYKYYKYYKIAYKIKTKFFLKLFDLNTKVKLIQLLPQFYLKKS